MTDLRFAGIHWPENSGGEHPDRDTIAAYPGIRDGCVLICAPSGRYHYDFLRQRSPLVVWRAIPRVGKRPAELGWNAERVAAECMNLWFEQPHGGTEWFLPLNEPQRADVELGGAFPGYGEWARFCAQLRTSLRAVFRGQDVRLMFPAFVPLDEGDHVEDWTWEAAQWDAICLHAYGSADAMQDRYQDYASFFPDKPIFVGEWNSNHEGHDERASLEMWADVAGRDTMFLGATYYIYQTLNAGEQDLSIYGNADRLDLFQHPPITQPLPVPPPAPSPEPVPDPIPEPIPMPTPDQMPFGIDVSNNNGAINWDAVATSGLAFAFAKATEGLGFHDLTFPRNWGEIKRVGACRGAYDFGRPDLAMPESEAQYFLDYVVAQGLDTGDMLALDLEDFQGSLLRSMLPVGEWTLRWLQYVERAVGFAPLLYTSAGVANQFNSGAYPDLARYGLWLASWRSTLPPPPPPWDLVAFWQNAVAPAGTVPGVGDIDLDKFNGVASSIPLYGKPEAAPAPPATSYNVGQGILDAMAARADKPASDEVYVKSSGRDEWSEAYGASGTRYVYIPSLGRTFAYPPAA